MDDSILTILFYIGIIVLVSISKFFSKSLKNSKKEVAFSEKNDVKIIENEDVNNESPMDYFLKKENKKRDVFSRKKSSKEDFSGEGVSAFMPINNSQNDITESTHYSIDESKESIMPLLANFDARAAILYSEILKRPEY